MAVSEDRPTAVSENGFHMDTFTGASHVWVQRWLSDSWQTVLTLGRKNGETEPEAEPTGFYYNYGK